MKSFLRLGAGLLRALVAMAVGLFSLFALFLEVFFFPSGKGASGPSRMRAHVTFAIRAGCLGPMSWGATPNQEIPTTRRLTLVICPSQWHGTFRPPSARCGLCDLCSGSTSSGAVRIAVPARDPDRA